jgi:hypothetical protein
MRAGPTGRKSRLVRAARANRARAGHLAREQSVEHPFRRLTEAAVYFELGAPGRGEPDADDPTGGWNVPTSMGPRPPVLAAKRPAAYMRFACAAAGAEAIAASATTNSARPILPPDPEAPDPDEQLALLLLSRACTLRTSRSVDPSTTPEQASTGHLA